MKFQSQTRVVHRQGGLQRGPQVVGRFNYATAAQMVRDPSKLPWKNPTNLKGGEQCVDRKPNGGYHSSTHDFNSWTGGSYQGLVSDWSGKVDMTPFERGLKMLGGLKKQLDTAMAGSIPKRRRCFSEHDGEWSYDRRFEIQPFQATVKRQTKNRSLEIYLYFDMLGMTPVEHGNKFGVLAWAVSRLVEMAGVSTRIIWVDETTHSGYPGNDWKSQHHSRTEVVLKEMGEFLAPSFMAAALTSNFYRRAGFGLIIYTHDQHGFIGKHSIGGAFVGERKAVRYEHGALHISMEAIDQTPEQLLPEIQKALA